jgi:CubicO group peptidase (beta-lactamase class C family)
MPSVASTIRRAIAPVRLLVLLCAFGAATGAAASECAFTAAQQRFDALLAQAGLDGGAMLLGSRSGLLLERYVGSYDADTVVPVASASKLLSALRVAQLAERGALDLDAPVSAYLPQFTGTKGTMTVAQMYSHTAGYGDDSAAPILLAPNLTLAQAVDAIACCIAMPDGWSPGTQFAYGGISMHVAGRVAEVVGGGDWQAQWQQQIGAPLGITTIDWQAFNTGSNYQVAGAARSNLRDYGRVLHMLANEGWSEGARVLHPATVRAIFSDRVGALPIAYAPPSAGAAVRYGLGNWLDATRAPGAPPFAHSLGAFGFFPFVDVQRGLFGVFMIEGAAGINTLAMPAYTEMLVSIGAELDAQACDPVERFVGVAGDGFESPVVDLDP